MRRALRRRRLIPRASNLDERSCLTDRKTLVPVCFPDECTLFPRRKRVGSCGLSYDLRKPLHMKEPLKTKALMFGNL